MQLTTEEKLVILMEECGEVIVAASKCLRFGYHRQQENYGVNDDVLASEIGDVLGMIDSLPLNKDLIATFRKNKLAKAEKAKELYGVKVAESFSADVSGQSG